MRETLATGAVLILACLAPTAASAAGGSIAPLQGQDACISDQGDDGKCEDGVMGQPYNLVVSPDGRNVYVGAALGTNKGVLALERDPVSGDLDQLPGGAGCYDHAGDNPDCTDVRGMDEPYDLALSPDGRYLYVTSSTSLDEPSGVVTFKRESDGALTQLPGADGCVLNADSFGTCDFEPRLPTDSYAIAVSPDGRHVIVGGSLGRVVAFSRDQETGVLTTPAGGCVDWEGAGGCVDGRAMQYPGPLEVSEGSDRVYTGGSDGIAVLQLAPATGALSQSPGPEGCLTPGGEQGCTPAPTLLGGIFDLALAAGSLYATSWDYVEIAPAGDGRPPRRDGDEQVALTQALTSMARLPDGTLVPFACQRSGAQTPATAACQAGTLAGAAQGLAVTDRALVTAPSKPDGGYSLQERDPQTGGLTPVAPPAGCAAFAPALGCSPLVLPADTASIALSPDLRHAYSTSAAAYGAESGNPRIFAFAITLPVAPAPLPPDVPVQPVARCAGKAATITGTAGRDRLRGTRRRDVIAALGGKDTVKALGGNDIVCGGSGPDKLVGGGGKDRLLGGAGKDGLLGQAGRDSLSGGAGKDRLLGGAGKDRLVGGGGRDRCTGGGGRDRAPGCERRQSV